MTVDSITLTTETFLNSDIPLAIYREISAHLQQIQDVTVQLLPQTASEFRYTQSQIRGLTLSYPSTLSSKEKQRLEEILNYYSQQFSPWQQD